MELRELLAQIVDTTSEAINREALTFHTEEPAQKDKVGVGILGATSALGLTSRRNQISPSVVVEESETDLFVTAGQGPKDLLDLFGSELTI
jgi:hypothetical protein